MTGRGRRVRMRREMEERGDEEGRGESEVRREGEESEDEEGGGRE